MKQSDIDVKYLMYDPFVSTTVNKLESYDEFKVDFEIDKSKVCAYIILLYDLNTQLRKEIPYFSARKIAAAELAGFKKNKSGKFIDEFEKILLGLNIKVNMAISKYIRLFAEPKYLSLVYYWSILTAEFENITNGTESKDFQKTISNIEKLESRIKECTDYLFGGDEVRDIRKALYESVEKENLRLRPEDIASSENIDELIGEGPYKGYKPSPLKFKSNR